MSSAQMKEVFSSISAASVQTTLVEIQRWPHWGIIQKVAAKEYGLTEQQFATLLPEYQRFLALAKYYPHLGMCSDAVDKIWHAHLYVRYNQCFLIERKQVASHVLVPMA